MSTDTEYINVKLPKAMGDSIDSFIKNNPNLGYKSRAEVVKDSLRKLIVKITSESSDIVAPDPEC